MIDDGEIRRPYGSDFILYDHVGLRYGIVGFGELCKSIKDVQRHRHLILPLVCQRIDRDLQTQTVFPSNGWDFPNQHITDGSIRTLMLHPYSDGISDSPADILHADVDFDRSVCNRNQGRIDTQAGGLYHIIRFFVGINTHHRIPMQGDLFRVHTRQIIINADGLQQPL